MFAGQSHNNTSRQYLYTSALLKHPRQTHYSSCHRRVRNQSWRELPQRHEVARATWIHLLWTVNTKHPSPPLWTISAYCICSIVTCLVMFGYVMNVTQSMVSYPSEYYWCFLFVNWGKSFVPFISFGYSFELIFIFPCWYNFIYV